MYIEEKVSVAERLMYDVGRRFSSRSSHLRATNRQLDVLSRVCSEMLNVICLKYTLC